MDKEVDLEKLKNLEEQNKEEQNKRRLLILVLSITTIVVSLIGATFAWFAANVNIVNGNESLVVKATEIKGVTFQAADNLVLTNALPGDEAETTFTIVNPNASAKIRYSLKFVADVNEFTNEDGDGQLLITVSNVDSSNSVVMDFTDGENKKEAQVVVNEELPPNQSDVYKTKLEFVELDKAQNSNQKKNFAGHIEITQSIAVQ